MAAANPLLDNDEKACLPTITLKNIHQISEWVLRRVFAVEASHTLKKR
ncbi:hypothetical protein CEXT_531191, partial [Caerostris extrusa]